MTTPAAAELRQIVADACSASSLHNSQPWQWVARHDWLELRADWSRHLRHTDPAGRDLVVSCGAALHTAVVAAAGRGWATKVRRLPDPERPELLAVLTFTPRRPTAAQLDLAAAAQRRRTDRREVTSWPVPDEWVQTLRRLSGTLGVLATDALDDRQAELLHQALEAARQAQERDPGYAAELETWTTVARFEGIPRTSLPDGDGRFPDGSLRDDYEEAGEPAPRFVLLATSSDDTISWLRTGEALAAVWIACTAGGISLVPLSQAVDVPGVRRILQDDLLDDVAFPQLALRIGWPPISREPVPPTHRRPVEQVLTFEARVVVGG